MMEKLAALQEELAKKVVLKGPFKKIRTIAGVDEAFLGKRIISAAVVCDAGTMEPVEKRYVIAKETFPYIPGFLAFREGPPIEEACRRLKRKPDALIINGCGINHPRFFGLASHVGVALGLPTIGVTKNLLCGEVRKGRIIFAGKKVGYKLKNIYVAPGHMVSARSALAIAKKCMRRHALPEPLALAHLFANRAKEELRRRRLP